MKIELIVDLAKLNKLITSIKVAGTKLDTMTHTAACSAIAHFAAHGDDGAINRLYLALAKGHRHEAMTAWLLAYGGVVANKDELTKDNRPFVKDRGVDGAAPKLPDIEGGMGEPWYDMKKSKAPDEVFDVLVLVQKLLKKAQASAKKEGTKMAHAAMLPELQALVEKFGNEEDAADQAE
jgi:hypothetical protein